MVINEDRNADDTFLSSFEFNIRHEEKISSLFDELFLIEYELKKAWCSGLHTVFFKEVVD